MKMKHNPTATANALAVVGGALYAICALWTLVSQSSYMGVMNTWAHGLNLLALPAKVPNFSDLAIGFISFTVVAWLVGFAFATLYNIFAGKK